MRKTALIIAAAAGFAASFSATPANADAYPWCAVYGGRAGGGNNCGFTTLQQCRETVSGMGGYCTQNQFYTGPGQTVRHKRKRVQS